MDKQTFEYLSKRASDYKTLQGKIDETDTLIVALSRSIKDGKPVTVASQYTNGARQIFGSTIEGLIGSLENRKTSLIEKQMEI